MRADGYPFRLEAFIQIRRWDNTSSARRASGGGRDAELGAQVVGAGGDRAVEAGDGRFDCEANHGPHGRCV